MKAVVIGVKENKAAVLMQDGSMRYVENRGYEKGTLLELPDTDDAVISFEKAKSKHNLRFPQRFLYSAAASFAVLMLSGAMVSFACPASTIPLSSDPEVTLGVNIYGRVIEINAGNEKNEELLKEIKREMKGRPVPEVSQAIELKFDEYRMESEDDQGAQAPAPENPGSRVLENPAPENPGSRDMEDPGSQNAEPPAPEIQQDQPSQGSEGDPDIEPPAPEKQESTGDQRPENPGSTGDQRPENPESPGDQRPENPGIPAVDNPAPENQGSPVMDNPGSQGTESPAPEIQPDQHNQDIQDTQSPAPEIQQDQPNQDGQDIEPPAPEIQQEQPGQDLEPPTHPEDNENPPETESGGHSEKPDDDTKDGPKEDHGPGPGDHGDGGRDGPGGGP